MCNMATVQQTVWAAHEPAESLPAVRPRDLLRHRGLRGPGAAGRSGSHGCRWGASLQLARARRCPAASTETDCVAIVGGRSSCSAALEAAKAKGEALVVEEGSWTHVRACKACRIVLSRRARQVMKDAKAAPLVIFYKVGAGAVGGARARAARSMRFFPPRLVAAAPVQKLAELRDTLQTKIHAYNEAVLSLRCPPLPGTAGG